MSGLSFARLIVVFIFVSVLAGCGDYYHYGLKRGISTSTLEQSDPHYIAGDYEFKSNLYRSSDGHLTITVQHPIHPLPEPEIFISQIGFEQNVEASNLIIKRVSFWHKYDDGSIVKPIEKFEISNQPAHKNTYYVLKYGREALAPKLTEYVEIEFSYNGNKKTIMFEEKVELVKRWNKAAVAISNQMKIEADSIHQNFSMKDRFCAGRRLVIYGNN